MDYLAKGSTCGMGYITLLYFLIVFKGGFGYKMEISLAISKSFLNAGGTI